MGVWPWRSRPVITPFRDNFSAPVITIAQNVTVFPIRYHLPDNFYFIPSSIVWQVTTAIGARSSAPTFFHLHRGGLVYSGATAGLLTNSSVQISIFAPIGAINLPAGTRNARVYPMPYPVYCYPHDDFEFDIPSFVAGDNLDYLTIHGQVWEVH